jgi:hypothetical protein
MRDSWPQVRARILGDPALQERLRTCTEWEAFAAEVGRLAGEPADLGAERQHAQQLFIERELPRAPLPFDGVDTAGWTPFHVRFDGPVPEVEWCDLRGMDLSGDGFFFEGVIRAMREPYRLLVRPRTPLEELPDADPDVAGLIMHTSRCGSTLACRMLTAVEGLTVLSEPAPCDHVLRASHASAAQRARWLRGLLAAFGGRLIVKLDAWSILEMDVVKAALPDVPWVFLTRDPAEVIASQMRQPGIHMMPGVLPPELFGLDLPSALALTSEAYCARVLALIHEAARRSRDARSIIVDYADLPGAVVDVVLPHFRVRCDHETAARMRVVAGFDAKQPSLPFDAAEAAAERPVTAAVRAAAGDVEAVAA